MTATPEKTLFVHIGCHKTGTTSIQHALALNTQALQEKGLHFYYRDFFTGKDKLPDLHSWLEFVQPRKVVPDGMRLRDARKLAEELSKLSGDVIVSSENFSFFFNKNEIENFKNALTDYFARVRIICYIRRQDRHVISHHQEGSKLYRNAEYDLFGYAPRAIPPHSAAHDLYLDYNKRLSMWGDCFGDRNIIIKIYDRKELVNADAVADFLEIFGISNFKNLDEKNTAVGFFEAKLGHLINGSPIRHKDEIFQRLVPKNSGSRMWSPSREEAFDYYQRFVDSNRLLNSRFGISTRSTVFDDDFASYPETGADLWDELSSNEVILTILKAVDDLYASLDVDEIRDLAIAMEGIDCRVSYKLMHIAHTLRPDGQLINKKLRQYKSRLESISDRD